MKNHLRLLRPKVKAWLLSPDEAPPDADTDERFNRWMLALINRGEIFNVGEVMVDRAVLATRFRCLPERCAPASNRVSHYRSCCAELALPLVPSERAQFRRHEQPLRAMLARDPALRGVFARTPPERPFFLERDGVTIRRPHKRCLFANLDKQGRIRCRLHGYARRKGLELSDVQPLSCRLFPLILINLGQGRVMLTVMNKDNWRLWQAVPPSRFPCLQDPTLPRLADSMRGTLDWIFGAGFASALKEKN